MDTMWISEFLMLYFQCVDIFMLHVSGLVTTIRYPEQKTLNISCWNTSQIQIQNIDVHEEETPCRQKPCVLNYNDKQTIEDNCNGENSCLVDNNFTSACLREFRYINLSYTCKPENWTTVSTFEKDFGDWKDVSTENSEWQRDTQVFDHTPQDDKGYSIRAVSWSGKAGIARITTSTEFIEPICLSLWYQFYANSYDCNLSIYKITDENQTLLFTVDGNSSLYNTWINILVDAYGKDQFTIALEADFKQFNSTAVRLIFIDDTSIAYIPCKRQQVHSACNELNELIEIECETQYLASEIKLFLEPENPTSHQTKCLAETIKNEILVKRFCKNLNKTDKCRFSVLNFTSGFEDCDVSSKNISVSFQCNIDMTGGSLNSPVQYDIIAIAAGVGGGVLIIIIVGVVIYRVRRSKTGPDNSNKAYDKNQYDYASQQHITSSESSNHNRNKQNNSNSNTQKQVLVFPNGQQSAGLYNMTDDGTYHVSSNSKHRENQNDINLYSHTSNNGTYDVSRNNEKREYQNDDNIYSQKADDVYDSAGHHKLPDRGEETYDHFFGQLTEDEYHTTTRT